MSMQERAESTLRFRLLLGVSGVTPIEVARATGASKSAVSRWLAGTRRVPPAAQATIARMVTERAMEEAFGR